MITSHRLTFCLALALLASAPLPGAEPAPRKVVLVAGPITGHPKDAHEYEKSVILLKHLLDTSPNAGNLRVEARFKGWPADPHALDDADCIVLITDGGDHREADHPLYVRSGFDELERHARRGCGIVQIHWTTFHPARLHERVTEILGGYFDYETGTGNPRWYSRIEHGTWDVALPSPGHPICRGVAQFRLQEEYYFRLRFRDADPRLTPILSLDPKQGLDRVVGWTIERADGGRSFGTTGGHFYANWWHGDFRRLILNAIVWAARLEVPAGGVASVPAERFRLLVVTGHNFPGHDWRATTGALIHVLEQDPRVAVDVTEDVEDLARLDRAKHPAIVLNYCNWDRPGLSEAAKRSLVKYLEDGGGLTILHFANGAFNRTLPPRQDTDWEEFRSRIVRRAWMHGDGQSGHDAFGPFTVEIAWETRHPIVAGLAPFATEDELYYRQVGDLPIVPLATARSRDTGKDEPLAWAYDYGQGRVFQTVLGHADVSVRRAGALVRRGAVWTARQDGIGFDPPTSLTEGALFRDGSSWRPPASKPTGAVEPPPAAAPRKVALGEGRFGKALDARAGGIVLDGPAGHREPPLTVECWARLESKAGFNILVSSEPKSSPAHWELYTYARSGFLAVYLPGAQPAEVISAVDVTDGRWHHLALAYQPARVRLFVDGRTVREQAIERGTQAGAGAARIAIGTLTTRDIGCDGFIDEVRISRGARSIDRVPEAPLEADAETIGLWPLDAAAGLETADPGGPRRNATMPASPGIDGGLGGHWGVKGDADWVDARVAAMDTGPFLCSSLKIPGGVVAKATTVRLGERGDAAMVFDAEALTFRAGWDGGFLRRSPARFGLIEMPAIEGRVRFQAPPGPAWGGAAHSYRALHRSGRRVALEYAVGDMEVREAPWVEPLPAGVAFARTFELGPSKGAKFLRLLEVKEGQCRFFELGGRRLAAFEGPDGATVAAIAGEGGAQWRLDGTHLLLELPVHRATVRLKLLIWQGAVGEATAAAAAMARSELPEPMERLLARGRGLWPERLAVTSQVSERQDPYVIDTIGIPFENPYRALIFPGGHDFFASGDAAVCTVHGDVWIVRGIDERLERVTWKRFAAGLYQPLGLKIVDETIHVLGRDQITVLRDLDGDDEADRYECLSNAMRTTAEGHDYHTCLETDAQGSFYYTDPFGLHRVARNGSEHMKMATGWRNPNGLGVGPDGTITVSPQEGEWTPASSICEVKPNAYYGYPGPRITPKRPLGYDPPLCWIPRHVDNSSGGQVWAESDRFGPLSRHLLHLSFGRSSMLLVLRDAVEGTAQGAVVPLKGRFLSGAMRGRMHPRDGQLYVTGLMGWVTNGIADGCFQRVRYTGARAYLPVGFHVHQNGVRLEFTEPLDRESAEDAGSYRVEQWGYVYAAAYGSEEYSIEHPGVVGHDRVRVESATLLEDGRTVFLEIPAIRPVDQLHIRVTLEARDGAEVAADLYGTIHRPGPPFDVRVVEDAGDDEAELVESALPPGLRLELRSRRTGATDVRTSRLAALRVPAGSPPSPFLEPGPFAAVWRGALRLEERSRLKLAATGRGTVRLKIDGKVILEGEIGESAPLESSFIRLQRGDRPLVLEYEAPETGDAWVRLHWQGRGFARESIPPAAFRREADDAAVERGALLRSGRELIATRRCLRCHAPRDAERLAGGSAAGFAPAPSLAGVGSRLEPAWMARWLEAPAALRRDATMPALGALLGGGDRAAAASGARDIAAFLATLVETDAPSGEPPRGDGSAGRELFAKLGCVACHAPPAAGELAAGDDRVSLQGTRAKWQRSALARYLLDPDRHDPWTRMPTIRLSAAEADALAAHLLGPPGDLSPPAAGDAAQGAALARQAGCLSCHEAPGLSGRIAAPAWEGVERADWSRTGCVAPIGARGRAPELALDPGERRALLALRAAGLDSLARESLPEAAEREIARLRCGACHERDGRAASWAPPVAAAPDTLASPVPGIVSQVRPSLTFAGEQLRSAWLEQLLGGRLGYTLRPWLEARMPAFPERARLIAHGLALEHGVAVDKDAPRGAVDAATASLGKQLLGTTNGFSCVTCHAVGEEPAQMPQHFGVVNLRPATERLRRDHYLRWLLNPQRLSPLTPMPAYADEDGSTPLVQVLGGDARRQFEAIWRYLETVR